VATKARVSWGNGRGAAQRVRPTERYITAVHESTHGVLRILLGLVFLRLQIEATVEFNGRSRKGGYMDVEPIFLEGWLALEALALSTLAPVHAEARLLRGLPDETGYVDEEWDLVNWLSNSSCSYDYDVVIPLAASLEIKEEELHATTKRLVSRCAGDRSLLSQKN
jgi:hypothetical protein